VDNYRDRKPFWLPAPNYYLLAAGVALAVFFLIWGILNDEGNAEPWIFAAIGSGVIFTSFAFLREVVLRKARNRHIRLQRKFDRQLNDVYARIGNPRSTQKLTMEQNAEVLREIVSKSNAAKTLGRLSGGHQEVFDLCSDYLDRIDRELQFIGIGSPRLVPLKKSRDQVQELHRFHLLQWAEIETREMTREAKSKVDLTGRVESAQHAIDVIDTALGYYENERTLIESRAVN
jgi:hypothetical protein